MVHEACFYLKWRLGFFFYLGVFRKFPLTENSRSLTPGSRAWLLLSLIFPRQESCSAAEVFPASEAVCSVASVLLECGSVLLSCN